MQDNVIPTSRHAAVIPADLYKLTTSGVRFQTKVHRIVLRFGR